MRNQRVVWCLTLGGTAIAAVLLCLGWQYYQTYLHRDAQEMARIRSFPASTEARQIRLSHTFRDGVSSISLSQSGPKSLTDQQVEKIDPRLDGWDTEAFGDRVSRQLKRLKKYLESIADAQAQEVTDLLAADFRCRPLRPVNLQVVFQDGPITVRRSNAPEGDDDRPAAAELAKPFELLLAEVEMRGKVQVELKLIGIENMRQSITTRVLVEMAATDSDRMHQCTAVWICRWDKSASESDGKLLLRALELIDYEEVVVSGRVPTLFADCTASALRETDSYDGQILHGVNFWASRLTRISNMDIFGQHGLAVADVNGDGLEDLYVCDSGGLPNRLYLQNPDGSLRDVSHEAAVNWLEPSTAALLVDLDNDGDQDLVVSTYLFVLFAENDGTGRFELRGGHRPGSLCAADYDVDGDLDIYICSYSTESGGLGPQRFNNNQPVPFHDANNGGANALLENRGRFRFVDVTDQIGLGRNNSRWSFAAGWDDYDNDGDLDLYVANDFGRNNLYRNQGGHFLDVAAEVGVQDVAAGMSVAWGDYNRDGSMDVYVGNMFSAAGNRVAYQRRFARERSPDAVADLQRMARGNTLFAGTNDGSFRDVSESANVTMGRWAWSSNFVDVNNDGWLDLVVANGYFTNRRAKDL